MNEYQRNRFTSRVIKCLNNTLVGKKITLLGYAFKKNTSDAREAPALEIIKTLLDENTGVIAIFDPCCNPYVIESEIRQLQSFGPPALRDDGGAVKVYSDAYEACASSNAILIVTEFDEFRNSDPVPSNQKSGSAVFGQNIPAIAQEAMISKPSKPEESKNTVSSPSVEDRLIPQPDCAPDCPDCQRENARDIPARKPSQDIPKKQVDWERIAENMQTPKWLFDGRCIIETKKMTKLGIRVESISSSRDAF